MGDTLRCKRGMVFWIDDKLNQDKNENYINVVYGKEIKEVKSHVMAGTRPWLVVSCDESNANSSICNVIPITSTKEDNYVYHVPFYHNDARYTALIEQIKTVDSVSMSGYLYTLEEKTMEKIELAMLSQFAIHQRLSCTEETLIEVVNLIEPTIKKVMLEKANLSSKVITSSNIEDIAIKISQNIEELFSTYQEPKKIVSVPPTIKQEMINSFNDDLIEDYHEEQPDEPQEQQKEIQKELQSQIKQSEKKPEKQKQEKPKDKNIKAEKKKNGQRIWTYKMKLDFLDDCEKMNVADIMKKWDMTSKGTYYSTKYVIKKEIRNRDMPKEKAV